MHTRHAQITLIFFAKLAYTEVVVYFSSLLDFGGKAVKQKTKNRIKMRVLDGYCFLGRAVIMIMEMIKLHRNKKI